jgi:tripartite-type tricarboxylate transporter receptor subunit TctC
MNPTPTNFPRMSRTAALCEAKPGQTSLGLAGAGSAQYSALEMFKLRAKGHPNEPTIAEEGFADFVAPARYGLAGPTPIACKINEDVNKVLAMADVQERLDAFGAKDGGGKPEKFANFIHSETAKWAKVVKDGGIKLNS